MSRRRGGAARARAAVLDAGRDPEPRQRPDARLDPRGRRARLRAVHAFGAAFDNPDLLVACVIGDGEAETAPLEGSWKGIRFLDPARDGAVLPILHLNESKIAGPTVLGRAPGGRRAGAAARPRLRAGGSSPATTRARCTATSPRRSTPLTPRSARSSTPPAPAPRTTQARRAGRRSCCARRRAGPARARSTARSSRGRFARIRSRWRACARTPRTSRSSSAGCAPTGPRRASTPAARSSPSSRRSRPTATCAWARCRTPTAAACSCRWTCPTRPPTRWR